MTGSVGVRQIGVSLALFALAACIPQARDYGNFRDPPPPPQLPSQAPLLTADPAALVMGNAIAAPRQRSYVVAAGDTGLGIARRENIAWQEIIALNSLSDPFILRVGQKLLLPDAGSAAPPLPPVQPNRADIASPSLEARAAAFSINIDDILTGSTPAVAQIASPSAPSDWRQAVTNNVAPMRFAGKFAWPVNGRLISGFGSKGGGKVNDGFNIAVPRGTPVKAAADGTVAYAGSEIGVFGGLVLINHGGGWVTAYGHADTLKVKVGDKVRMGQTIGLAGESGYVSEPQLHFEIRKDRVPVDPASYLPPVA
ncbi:MAG: M23 family metallopeptidase [Parasphingorhabdus sp.]|nr:M23 family metallopeptidase [Parasphingorhabdus sp.]